MALMITKPVGNGGANVPADVGLVQRLLNAYLAEMKAAALMVDGVMTAKTLVAIRDFQGRKLMMQADGIVNPEGKTFAALVGLYGALVAAQGKPLGAKGVVPTVSATAAGQAVAERLLKKG